MTVQANIEAGMHRLTKRERRQIAQELIAQFHLDSLEKRRPETLSGGEKQRVALARIIASSPEVLLLDEPFASLDTLLKLELIPSVREIIEHFGKETILVSHDIDEVRQLCNTVVPIAEGVTKESENTENYYHILKEHYQNLK